MIIFLFYFKGNALNTISLLGNIEISKLDNKMRRREFFFNPINHGWKWGLSVVTITSGRWSVLVAIKDHDCCCTVCRLDQLWWSLVNVYTKSFVKQGRVIYLILHYLNIYLYIYIYIYKMKCISKNKNIKWSSTFARETLFMQNLQMDVVW